eukprot:COSAG02_NODE_1092_length_14622_cov_95.061971_7_plen_83_part_00
MRSNACASLTNEWFTTGLHGISPLLAAACCPAVYMPAAHVPAAHVPVSTCSIERANSVHQLSTRSKLLLLLRVPPFHHIRRT